MRYGMARPEQKGKTMPNALDDLGEKIAATIDTLIEDYGFTFPLYSIAIGVIMRAFANYRGRGGEIKLCGLGKRLKDLFIMTKLIMVFDHHETEEQTLAAFAVDSDLRPTRSEAR